MLFGLRNASATFQRFIDQVCQGLSNIIAYVDDIVVFSNSEEEHKLLVLELFERYTNLVFALTFQNVSLVKTVVATLQQIRTSNPAGSHTGLRFTPLLNTK